MRLAFKLFIIFTICILGCQENISWKENENFRQVDLSYTPNQDAGFTAIDNVKAGVTFANKITNKEIVKNRHLMHGSGVATGDVNGDGLIDVYLAALNGDNHLYLNQGNWEFKEVAAVAGVQCSDQYSTGVLMADVDNDFDLDLLVNALGGKFTIFFNDGSGDFTNSKTLHQGKGSTSISLADIDLDGDLDIYNCSYKVKNLNDSLPPNQIDWDVIMKSDANDNYEVTDQFKDHYRVEKRGNSLLKLELGERDVLYLNEGNGSFVAKELTSELFKGKSQAINDFRDWGLVAQFRDFNNDGKPDIYVCNDYESPDYIWVNKGGYFEEASPMDFRHSSNSSMSVDFTDINSDGKFDMFVSDMLSQSHVMRKKQMGTMVPTELAIGEIENRPQYMRNTLFVSREDETYREVAQYAGIQASEWSWSSIFCDVDLDGDEDLLVSTGHLFDVQDSDANQREQEMVARSSTFEAYRSLILKYPALQQKNIAFESIGNLKFKGVKDAWGIGENEDVTHGMSMADLDNDGDLDLVTNRLNDVAGFFENKGSSDRVAVRLIGANNAQAIGAKLILKNGEKRQVREVISGGRYLSGNDTQQVFAITDKDAPLELTVVWPGSLGQSNYVLDANSMVEINRPTELQDRLPTKVAKTTYFKEVKIKGAIHKEKGFDDFSLQSLLPNRLSQLGPGMASVDWNQDGHIDILYTNGKDQAPTLLKNDGEGNFSPQEVSKSSNDDQLGILTFSESGRQQLVLGESNYESNNSAKIKIGKQSLVLGDLIPFAISMADIDKDGDIDLFISGRGKKGQYPQFVDSKIILNQNGVWKVAPSNTFKQVGMVTSSVFTDFNNDGAPDLVIASEWGQISLFENDNGAFLDVTGKYDMARYTGWWNGVTAGDFNNDGLMDLVATNWGLNSKYHLDENPLKIYYSDFNEDGEMDIIEAHFDDDFGGLVPERGFSCMSNAIPFIRDEKQTYDNYANSDLGEIFGSALDQAPSHEVSELRSLVFINKGGYFEAQPLPIEIQLTTAMSPTVGDFNSDGNEDLFISQNFYAVQKETDRNDSGRGALLFGDGNGGFEFVDGANSGIKVYGEQRAATVADFNGDNRLDLAVSQNGSALKIYENAQDKQGLKVVFKQSANTAQIAGTTLRLVYKDGLKGPRREVHVGEGYLSQNHQDQLLGFAKAVESIEITRPSGKVEKVKVNSGQIIYEIN